MPLPSHPAREVAECQSPQGAVLTAQPYFPLEEEFLPQALGLLPGLQGRGASHSTFPSETALSLGAGSAELAPLCMPWWPRDGELAGAPESG